MRAVIQRVTSARVRVGDRVTGEIQRGLLVLLGVGKGDSQADVQYIAGKIRDLRVFESDEGKPMDRSPSGAPPSAQAASVASSSSLNHIASR